MKYIYLLFILMINIDLKGQMLPSDSILLIEIFGKTDKGSMTFSRPFDKEKGEGINTYEDKIVWKIVFKDTVNLQKEDFIITVIDAKDLTHHGHQFGYRNMYFFKQINNKVKLVDSITNEDEIGLGDNSAFEIVDIGKEKKALIIQFGSSGNQHFEGSKSINLLELGKLTYLLSAESYDNSAWKIPESENMDCDAIRYDENFEILKSNKDFYDIKIHRIDYGFTKGCKDSYIKLETDKIYSYFDGKFKEKNN